MTWFPVVAYRWVRESILRVPVAILNRLGMLDAPIDDDQEILVQIREDEEQQPPRERNNGQELPVQTREDEEQQSPRQRHNSEGTLVSTSEDEEQQSPRQRQDSQEALVHTTEDETTEDETTEDEEQYSLLQQQLPNGVFYLPTPHPNLAAFYRASLWAPGNTRLRDVWPSPRSTNGPQQAADAADAATDPGYSGNDAGQGQTGYRTPDPDSGYDSMN